MINMTDAEVIYAIRQNSSNSSNLSLLADRIVRRQHFRVLYRRNPDDIKKNPDAASAIHEAASKKFGTDNVRLDQDKKGGGAPDFPVLSRDGRIVSSLTQSQVLGNLPETAIDYVFVEPSYREGAAKWLNENREDIIGKVKEEDGESIE